MAGGRCHSQRKIICHQMIKAWTTIESIMMESGEDTGEILEREFIEVPNRQMRQKKEEV